MNNKLFIIIGIQLALLGCTLEDPIYCKENDIKCDNINDVGMLYHCTKESKWGDPTPCDEKMKCAEDGKTCLEPEYCTPGDTKCEDAETGGILKTCDDTQHWSSGTPCIENKKCTEDGKACLEPKFCMPGETVCEETDQGGLLKTCDDTQHWNSGVPCKDNQGCTKDGRGCASSFLCTSEETSCENTETGGIFKQCDADGHWTSGEPCENGKMCKDEFTCESPAQCIPLTVQCTDKAAGSFLKTCDDNGYWTQEIPCEDNQPCQDATSCTPPDYCTPGDTVCTDQTFDTIVIGHLSLCKENKKWSTPEACDGNAACKDTHTCGEAQDIKCKDQPTTCQNTIISDTEYGQLLICKNGTVTPQSCPDNASCKDETTCGNCINGTTKCEDGKLHQCQKGKYEYIEDCETGKCSIDKTHCQTCEQSCSNSSSIGHVTRTCEGDEPQTYICENVSCNPDNTDCGECKINTNAPPTTCTDDEGTGIGYLDGCKNGKQFNHTPCENNYSCTYAGGFTCGDCHNGDIRCTLKEGKGFLQVCLGGAWGGPSKRIEISCPNDSVCNSEETACLGGANSICIYPQNGDSVGSVYRADGTYTRCNEVSCNPDLTDCGDCKLYVNAPSLNCQNDSYGIGYITGCKKGQTVSNEACPDKASCSTENSCGECHSGNWKCEENASGIGILSECKEGEWDNSTYNTYQCPGKCNANHTFCDTPNSSICVTRSGTPEGDIATLFGNSINLERCPNNFSCDEYHKCGTCNTMMPPSCVNGILNTCANGTLNMTLCSSGECKNTTQCK